MAGRRRPLLSASAFFGKARLVPSWPAAAGTVGSLASWFGGAAGFGVRAMASPSRRLQTKPVITCLKSVLLIYTFIFWVRKGVSKEQWEVGGEGGGVPLLVAAGQKEGSFVFLSSPPPNVSFCKKGGGAFCKENVCVCVWGGLHIPSSCVGSTAHDGAFWSHLPGGNPGHWLSLNTLCK